MGDENSVTGQTNRFGCIVWAAQAVGFYECWDCFGEGTVVEQRPVWLAFPAGVSDQSLARVSLARLGMPDAYLVVRFRVRG